MKSEMRTSALSSSLTSDLVRGNNRFPDNFFNTTPEVIPGYAEVDGRPGCWAPWATGHNVPGKKNIITKKNPLALFVVGTASES